MRQFRSGPMVAISVSISLFLVACTQGIGAPSQVLSPRGTPQDPMVEVREALVASGINIVGARPNATDATFSCLSGAVHPYAFDQEAPHPTFRPGEKPPINALSFASRAARQAAQHQISSDGTQITGPGCGAMIDWVAPPHWAGGGPYLLLVVSADNTLAAQVAAAAVRLGSP